MWKLRLRTASVICLRWHRAEQLSQYIDTRRSTVIALRLQSVIYFAREKEGTVDIIIIILRHLNRLTINFMQHSNINLYFLLKSEDLQEHEVLPSPDHWSHGGLFSLSTAHPPQFPAILAVLPYLSQNPTQSPPFIWLCGLLRSEHWITHIFSFVAPPKHSSLPLSPLKLLNVLSL